MNAVERDGPIPLIGAVAIGLSYIAFAATSNFGAASIALTICALLAIAARGRVPIPRLLLLPAALLMGLITFSNPPAPPRGATFLLPAGYGIGLFVGIFALLYLLRPGKAGEHRVSLGLGMALMAIAGSTSERQPFAMLLAVQGLLLAICLRYFFPPALTRRTPGAEPTLEAAGSASAGLIRSVFAYLLVGLLALAAARGLHSSERAFNTLLMLADTRGFSYPQRSTLRGLLDMHGCDQVLLRVTSPAPATYLMGRCYIRFDRGAWDAQAPHFDLPAAESPALDDLLGAASFFSLTGKNRRFDANWMPAVVDRIEPAGEFRGNFFIPRDAMVLGARTAEVDGDNCGMASLPQDQSYQGEYVAARDPRFHDTTPPAPGLRDMCLTVPKTVRAYTMPLAMDITRDATTDLERARAIERYLQTHYEYSDKYAFKESDALHEFLVGHVPAHCEFFASGMAMLLRVSNIPARYVAGFLVEERNDSGGYYIVREEHAHAWVEAYIAGRGWEGFDPTPPADRPHVKPQGELSRWLDMLFYRVQHIKSWFVSLGWRRMLTAVVGGAQGLGHWLIERPWRIGLLLLLFFAEALFRRADAPGRRWLRRLLSRGGITTEDVDPVLQRMFGTLHRFDRVVEHLGQPRPTALTLHEFAATLNSQSLLPHGGASAADRELAWRSAIDFLNGYATARYGTAQPSAEQVAQLEATCAHLEVIARVKQIAASEKGRHVNE